MQFKYPTRYRPYNMKGLQYSCIQFIGKKQEAIMTGSLRKTLVADEGYVTQQKLPEC